MSEGEVVAGQEGETGNPIAGQAGEVVVEQGSTDDPCLQIFRLIHERQYEQLKEIAHEKFNCEMSLKDLNEKLKLGLDAESTKSLGYEYDLTQQITPLEFALKWSFLYDTEYAEKEYNSVFTNGELTCLSSPTESGLPPRCDQIDKKVIQLYESPSNYDGNYVNSQLYDKNESNRNYNTNKSFFKNYQKYQKYPKYKNKYLIFARKLYVNTFMEYVKSLINPDSHLVDLLKIKEKIEKIEEIIYLICQHTQNYKEILDEIKSYKTFYLCFDSSEIVSAILSQYPLHIDLSLLADLKKQESTDFDKKKTEISTEIKRIGNFLRDKSKYKKEMLKSKYPTTQLTPEVFAKENGLSDLFPETKSGFVSSLFSKGGSKKRKTNKQKSKKRKNKKSKRRV
jgi:hypothetical protein